METENVVAHDAEATYPSSYPAGVFVVTSKQQLAHVVARLRAANLLKPGRNVTVFDAEHFAEVVHVNSAVLHTTSKVYRSCCDTPCAISSSTVPQLKERIREGVGETMCISPLHRTLLRLYETSLPEESATASSNATVADPHFGDADDHFCVTSTSISGPSFDRSLPATLPLSFVAPFHCSSSPRQDVELFTVCNTAGAHQFLSLLRTSRSQRAHNGLHPFYMAVHVVGELSSTALKDILSPQSWQSGVVEASGSLLPTLSPPVAYVRGVRRYHRVCCPDLSDMPSALFALRRASLQQRCPLRSLSPPLPDVGRQSKASVSHSSSMPRISDPPSESCDAQSCRSANVFTFSELFGGIGMFRTALEPVGGRSMFAVEFALPAQAVYTMNHRCWHNCAPSLKLPNARPWTDGRREESGGGTAERTPPTFPTATTTTALQNSVADAATLLVGDITEIPSCFFPHHDVLTGGFPCQSFAKAGTAAGLHAEKGALFYEVVRVLAATQPAVFLLENVEHLVEVEAGAQLHEILMKLRYPLGASTATTTVTGATDGSCHDADLNAVLEYEVRHVVVDGGLLTPQTRRRVYFFGFLTAPAQDGVDVQPLSSMARYILPERGEEARRVAAKVVADAVRRVQEASDASSYRTVSDLLVAPSTREIPCSAVLRRRCDADVHAVGDTNCNKEVVRMTGEDLRLTPAQWEAVQRSRTFRQNPLWRLCDLRGRARTLLGSYRNSYQLYSEFVPFSDMLTFEEVREWLQRIPEVTRFSSSSTASGDATKGSPTVSAGSPPLRLFALRECARLQGIADDFILPHDAFHEAAQASSAAAVATAAVPAPSAAILRQIPSGAVYKLLGNAVNPRVVTCLGDALASYLRERRRS